MIIGLFHPDKAAIRKEIALAILQAMLQDAFCYSEIKCLKYLKSMLSLHHSFSAQLRPIPSLAEPLFPAQRELRDSQAKPYLLSLLKPYYGDRMTDIMPHKHCMVCGNAVRPDENFCDELCESKFKSAQRKQQLLISSISCHNGTGFVPAVNP